MNNLDEVYAQLCNNYTHALLLLDLYSLIYLNNKLHISFFYLAVCWSLQLSLKGMLLATDFVLQHPGCLLSTPSCCAVDACVSNMEPEQTVQAPNFPGGAGNGIDHSVNATATVAGLHTKPG